MGFHFSSGNFVGHIDLVITRRNPAKDRGKTKRENEHANITRKQPLAFWYIHIVRDSCLVFLLQKNQAKNDFSQSNKKSRIGSQITEYGVRQQGSGKKVDSLRKK